MVCVSCSKHNRPPLFGLPSYQSLELMKDSRDTEPGAALAVEQTAKYVLHFQFIAIWNHRVVLGKQNQEGTMAAHKGAEHHHKAAEHHEQAAKHHHAAAEHHEKGEHEQAAHHADTAYAHHKHAEEHAAQAAKHDAEHHAPKPH